MKGNTQTAEITITVLFETTPPSISGVHTIDVYQNTTPNYLDGLSVFDNVSVLNPSDIVVDDSAVDLTTPGIYTVFYTVTDEAGNSVTEQVSVWVWPEETIGEPDSNATYRASISSVSNLNPHHPSVENAAILYSLISDSLYIGDYDWAAARDILVADGITDLPIEIGFDEWYQAGYHAEDLPFNYFPRMADTLPFDVNGDGLVWEITVRDDLEFEDGTAINASTFEYSWRMLLDPDLSNNHASTLYSEDGLPLINAEAYYNQTIETPVAWNEVGFETTGTYTFRITLDSPRAQWDVISRLEDCSTGVVHEVQYEHGMNEERTTTTYGTIANPLLSYGPYNMISWDENVSYSFALNSNHYSANQYPITKLRYDIIEDQSVAVDEFKAGRLDVVDIGGEYYDEFKDSFNLKLSPKSTFFRFAFNIAGSDQYDVNPILNQVEFRQAFYFAFDRETFSNEVRDPSVPTFGFLGPVYYSTQYNTISYRSSEVGTDSLSSWAPSTFGYDPVRAKELFDTAYAAAVSAGDIQDGEMVSVEYKFYDVETGWNFNGWIKNSVEAIFNEGETTPKFELTLAGVSSAALDDAWENGHFEMTFGGWQSLDFDAPAMLGQVYNSSNSLMLEGGFDTANAEVTATLPNTKAALTSWTGTFAVEFANFLALYNPYIAIAEPTLTETADYEAAVALLPTAEVPTDDALAEYHEWLDVLALFVGDDLECTYHELFSYAYGEFYNVADVNYMGKDDDFDEITATLEAELLNQMIAIPLFSSVSTKVYSIQVGFEADSYHARMGWGGLKYMYIRNFE